MIFLTLWLALLAPDARPTPKSNFELRGEMREAYKREDRAAFLSITQELVRRTPGEVFNLYNLASAQSLNGEGEAAVRSLEEILAHRVAYDLDADKNFEPIRRLRGYESVRDRMNAFRKETITSGATRAFTIPEKGFIAEGVAYDSKTRSFFVASIRHRRIVRIDASGRVADLVPAGRDGLRSAMGMRVDPERRTLWVASQALPSMDGYQKDQPVSSAVFEFDVDSGRLRKEHVPPPGAKPPAFDDLTVAADGTVFVNDAETSRIWRIPPGGKLEVLATFPNFSGSQGLALSSDGKTLYASDYRGLFAIDLARRSAAAIGVPADLALSGIDGLVRYENSLIAIQNGITPHRVIRLDLARDGVSIAKARILEMNHPDFDEPTLGVVVDRALYLSADSQGQKYLDDKNPIRPEEARDAVILKLPL
jgi:sugar lactone lactonase YvrE